MRHISRKKFALLAVLISAAAVASCDKSSESKTQSEPEPRPTIVEVETGPDDGSAAKPAEMSTIMAPQMAVGKQGAVTSAEANATDIGLAVLKRGGNAVDAAVAVGFALGVTHPSAGNIGGGGFMVISMPDGTSTALDYREMAPGAATADMYLDPVTKELGNDSVYGPRAAGIPGVVAGLWLAHKKYGSLPWKSLVEPSVLLARDGWTLDGHHAEGLSWVIPKIEGYRDGRKLSKPLREAVSATLATFRKSETTMYKEGDVWKQPELAATLEAIANGGQDAFYKGTLAKTMAKRMQEMGGLWTEKDLANYHPVVRKPIEFDFRGHTVITMPPPSAGGVVLRQVLAAADVLNLNSLDWDSAERTHLYVEALRRIYADRNELIGDPDFIEIPMDKLLDVVYTKKRMATIDPKHATPSSEIRSGVAAEESEQTTHFSIIDKNGMAVANTYTLNGGFGAKLQIPGTGVTLNNEMDDFTAKVGAPNMFGLIQGPQNAIAPGKRMLSSMSPTIVLKDDKVRAILGSPGGPTITTTVAQILMQIIGHKRTLEQAISAPRVHHQWLPDAITYESNLAPSLARELSALGHTLKSRRSIGHANCIEVTNGNYHAAADTERAGGKAAAY